MGRGKRSASAIHLSDSPRAPKLAPAGDFSPVKLAEDVRVELWERLHRQLGLGLADPPPAHRHLFFLSSLDYRGEPFAALDQSFASLEEARDFYASRASDPDDPNPLPHLVFDLDAEEPKFEILHWQGGEFEELGYEIELTPGLSALSLYQQLEELAGDY